jgi:hypothetical protein
MRLNSFTEVREIIRTMDGADNIGVYGEAKAEYTRQLCSFLVPALEAYFLDLLADIKSNEKDPKRFLWVFQDSLKQFPDWNIDKVQRETEKIQTATRCDYLEEILTAVFIAHTKVLSAIRLTSKQKKLQITIPKIEHFLHRTMSECARSLWSNAYLFSDSGPAIERQKNLRQVEQLLHEAVLQSIRGMVPVKSILKEYLSDDTDEPASGEATEGGAQEEEKAPVVHEESIQAPPPSTSEPETDISGTQIPILEETAPIQQTEAIIEEPKKEESEQIPDISANVVPVSTVPTIIVDTEPPTVGFTHMDAVLDSENPEQSIIQASTQKEEDGKQEVSYIDYDLSAPGEVVDEFEDLEDKDELLVGEDEFETL